MNRIRTRPVVASAEQTLRQSGLSPLMARLFAARAVAQVEELENRLDRLIPYHSLKNIRAVAERLAQAIQQQQRILIVADYDADGATACSVGVLGLRRFGAQVDYFVPNRFEHGYGLTPQLADIAAARQTDLIVTVDNGIASIEGVRRAHELGLEVIITDHHLPSDSVPDCLIINPNQHGCAFPSKNLAGVGVIFYVITALRACLVEQGHFREQAPPNLADLLDLVALGTVADVVPLDHNNRILVEQGIKRIRAGRARLGIQALFRAAHRNASQAAASDLGFAIAPRLNAAGRLDDMAVGIACLLAQNETEAQSLAERLNDLNHERRQIEQSMLTEAMEQAEQAITQNRIGIVLFRQDWHQGVIGIVAGRLKDRFHRPSFVFAPADGDEIRGSGRSIAGLHLRDTLDLIAKRDPELILKFGGHAMAAGLSIRRADFDRFCTLFESTLASLVDEDILSKTFLTDGNLPSGGLTLDLAQTLGQTAWGQNFPAPSFHDEFQVLWQKPVGNGHKKAGLLHHNHEVEAMFFRCDTPLPERIRSVYRPIANQWRQQIELQLHIDYWEHA